jgi:hypothetical protein
MLSKRLAPRRRPKNTLHNPELGITFHCYRESEVAQMNYQGRNWSRARRLILIRHRVQENNRSGGKVLLDCPGYHFQALVTNLPLSVEPIQVWRDYNGRAGIEGVIKELDYGFGLPRLCCEKFWATEAALSLAALTYNLNILFQHHLGWMERVNVATLRYRLFQKRRTDQLGPRSEHHKNRHRSPKSSVVAPSLGENPLPNSQLQCSWE